MSPLQAYEAFCNQFGYSPPSEISFFAGYAFGAADNDSKIDAIFKAFKEAEQKRNDAAPQS